ncbi:UNVERIFIED_CONTAM: hypothetical protein FKN15_064459 [Acipenser sinensis]
MVSGLPTCGVGRSLYLSVVCERLPVDRDWEFLGGDAQLAEHCPGREGLGRQGNPRLTAHQRPLWPIGHLWFCSGATRSVLSSGTIGLVALLWTCSAKNDGLAGACFGGRVLQPPFSESAGGLRAFKKKKRHVILHRTLALPYPAVELTLLDCLSPPSRVLSASAPLVPECFNTRLSCTRRWEPLARQQAQALAVAPVQPITPALELTPPVPVVAPDVTEPDFSFAEEDHDAIMSLPHGKVAPSFKSIPYLP